MNKHTTLTDWLVIAAAIITGLSACDKVNNNIDEPILTETPKPYTLTVTASRSSDTRALSLDGEKLNATWAKGETVDVYQPKQLLKPGTVNDYREYSEKVGTLTAQADGATVTLSGTVTLGGKTNLVLYCGSPSYDYRGQSGSLADISGKYDYASVILFKSKYNLEDGKIILKTPETPLSFDSTQAIVKFTLKDLDGNDFSVSSLSVGTSADYEYNVAYSIATESAEEAYTREASFTVTPAKATSEFYVAMPWISNMSAFPLRLETSEGGFNYCYEESGVSFTRGQYYEMTVTMERQPETLDLSTFTGDFTLVNGDELTGTLDGTTQKLKVSIADGATVTLNGATINGVHYNDSECLWAGITCLGDATIVLADGTTNTVTNFNRYYPCIQTAEGKTLTIEGGPTGTGKLIANNPYLGAGIGGGIYMNCGNIEIHGGEIIAKSYNYGAGIGGGLGATCGTITISGGTVMAMGGMFAAGIGCGHNYGSCGDITITGGNVTATGGDEAAGIGCGIFGSCGNISISGGNVRAQGFGTAAGIGCGCPMDETAPSVCGDISISNGEGFVSVVAIRGDDAFRPIGVSHPRGDYSRCGQIYFDGVPIINEVGATDASYDPDNGPYGSLNFTKTTQRLGDNDQQAGNEHIYDNNTWTLTP